MNRWTSTALRAYHRHNVSCNATLLRSYCAASSSTTAPIQRDVSLMSEDEKLEMLNRGIAPSTGRPLKEIAADVWGWNKNPVGPGHRSGAKILRRPLKGPLYMEWYPPPASAYKNNEFPLTEKQERWRAKLRLLRAAGKGPPKKGEGKRKK